MMPGFKSENEDSIPSVVTPSPGSEAVEIFHPCGEPVFCWTTLTG